MPGRYGPAARDAPVKLWWRLHCLLFGHFNFIDDSDRYPGFTYSCVACDLPLEKQRRKATR